MENYIVIKDLPDAPKGTKVIWDEGKNHFFYEKSAFVSPHDKAYLTAGQVTQTPEFFEKAPEIKIQKIDPSGNVVESFSSKERLIIKTGKKSYLVNLDGDFLEI